MIQAPESWPRTCRSRERTVFAELAELVHSGDLMVEGHNSFACSGHLDQNEMNESHACCVHQHFLLQRNGN